MFGFLHDCQAVPGIPKLVADFIHMVCNGEASGMSDFLHDLQASMVKLKNTLESILAVPHHLSPCLIKRKPSSSSREAKRPGARRQVQELWWMGPRASFLGLGAEAVVEPFLA